MKINNLTRLLLISVIAVSCQKGSDATSSIDAQLDSKALGNISCQPGDSGLSIAEAKILGTENLAVDKSTLLSLESNVNCAQAEKAQWFIGNTPIGQGGQIQTKVNGTGVYYIKVSSVANSSTSDGLAVQKASVTAVSSNAIRVSVQDTITLEGTQVGVEFNSYAFTLKVPNGITLKSADWNFGAGVPLRHSLTSESKSFSIGTHTFSVVVTDTNDKVTTLQHTITILPISAGIDCTPEELATIEIAGFSPAPKGEAMDYSVNIPACLAASVSKVSWNFGDGSATASTMEVEHTYAAKGDYNIAVAVWLGSSTYPSFSVNYPISVVDTMEEFPGPDPGNPTNPNACSTAGATRTVDGAASTKEVACGLNGKRTDNYKEQIVQICQVTNGSLSWVEQSKSLVLVSEGACMNQSCSVPGQPAIANGQTVVLYSSQNPMNSCDSVKESRLCNNGVLSGSASAVYATCQSGCGDFGANGTVKTGVIVGSISTPVQCSFQEAGIYDVYEQVADKTCVNGQVVTSNTRQGGIKEKGSCPAYSWYPTDRYTTCSANCGGNQSLIYACRDNRGVDADSVRCASVAPVTERVCDANPDAVRQSTTTTDEEEAGSSATCPKNQIGVIVKERTVSTTVTVACIDHKVQEESRKLTYSDWISTSYCRDLVPMRCSQDSLSNSEAQGRYDWMVKCKDQVPVIKEFLEKFDGVEYKGINLDESTRHLYPTFLDSSTKKPWIAPKRVSGSCTVPATAYVAAVCVSSCSTPEQEVIAEVEKGKALRKVSFIDAWTQKLKKVGTLHPYSSIASTQLEKTEVDNWVTELLDTTQPILTFKLKSGGQLKITPNHAMLNQDGAMQVAQDFKVNDNFVRLGGRLDKIVAIEKSDYYGKVYNVFVNSNELKKNVVVINGYLSGTAFYQNEGAKYMNRDLFRKNLTHGAFDK